METLDYPLEELDQLYQMQRKVVGTSLHEHKDGKIAIKLDDPLSYVEANRLYLQHSPPSEGDKEPSLGKKNAPSGKAQNHISPDCVCDEKAVISGSFVSSNCLIEANTRIVNCVLLPGATVKDGANLQGCVLGENVTVESQCRLKNCAVAAAQRVPDGTVLESEQLGFTDPDLEVAQP